jgi:hypothetical protein
MELPKLLDKSDKSRYIYPHPTPLGGVDRNKHEQRTGFEAAEDD